MELSKVHGWFRENEIFVFFLKIKLLMNISFINFKYFLIDNG